MNRLPQTPDGPYNVEATWVTPEPVYCSWFGCGKILSLDEQRCGDKCITCQNIEPIDINNYIKKP